MLCYAIIYYTTQCYAMLYYSTQCYAMLYYTMLYYTPCDQAGSDQRPPSPRAGPSRDQRRAAPVLAGFVVIVIMAIVITLEIVIISVVIVIIVIMVVVVKHVMIIVTFPNHSPSLRRGRPTLRA